MKDLVYLLLAVSVMGCVTDAGDEGDGRDDAFSAGKADTGGIVDGSAEAIAVLRVANERSEIEMRDHGLSARPAQNIVALRDGDDEVAGTSDDVAFTTLHELDAVPFVGPQAFARLLAYANDLGYLLPAPGPTIMPPSSPWNVSACPRLTWAQMVARFGAGQTFFDWHQPFAIATRRRVACNEITGCTPWYEHPLNVADTLFSPTSGGNIQMLLDTSTGDISVQLRIDTTYPGAASVKRVQFNCTGIDRQNTRPTECTIATYVDAPYWSYLETEFGTQRAIPGRFCADGRFHFASTVPNDGGNSKNNLEQFAIYGRLF